MLNSPITLRRSLLLVATGFAALLGSQQISYGEDNVLLSMADYDDLLNRIDSLESRVATTSQTPVQRKSTGVVPCEGGVFAAYDLVLLKPVYSNNTAFYVHDTAVGVDESAILTEFTYGAEASHRLELGYLSPTSNLGWRSRFWFFDVNDSKQSGTDVDVKIGIADDPDIAIDTISSTSPDFYLAESRTALHVLDTEFISKRQIYQNNVTLASGLRYASVEHGYFGRDIEAGLTENFLRTQFNFRGLGPTLALQSRRSIQGTGFGWNVGARTSLLFGKTDAVWERVSVGGSSDAIRQDNFFRMLPVAELQLGLDYRRCVGSKRLELGTGFEAQGWFNGGTPLAGGQDGATDSDRISSPFDEDLGFVGVYFRGSITY